MTLRPSWTRLRPRDARLLLAALAIQAACQVRLRCQSFAGLQAWATRPGSGGLAAEPLTWAVKAVSRRTGAACLSQALTLQRLLARNGHASQLRIGVRRPGKSLAAHAWLVHEGRTLIGGADHENYTLLAAWAPPESAEPGVRLP
jgi:hypothetical protein